MTRRFSPPGSTLQPGRILMEMGADFGALVELVELTAEERDVRTSTRTVRTKGGQAASYTLEEGRIQYALVAEVTLFDDRGMRLESFSARHSGSEGFRWQRAALQESLVVELAEEIASGIFDRVVRRIA